MNTENNALIAEFMGLVESSIKGQFWTKKSNEGFGMGQLTDLKYDSSWDWLMPVIEKIDNLRTLSSTEESYLYCVSLMGNYAKIWDPKTKEIVISVLEEYDYTWQEVAYKLTVDFVKWYKENKNHDNGN